MKRQFIRVLQETGRLIDALNRVVGKGTAWLLLAMLIVQLSVVVMRYVFGLGSIKMQEGVIYLHAFAFMLGAAYTLLADEHVRVDFLYRQCSERQRALINLFGTVFFLWPVLATITWAAFPYVIGSWAVLEGSAETSGIQARYLLKSAIIAFGALMALQGLSTICHAVALLFGSAPKRGA